MLNIIVDNCEHCGQQNILQSCLQQYCNKLFVSVRGRGNLGVLDVRGCTLVVRGNLEVLDVFF